LVKSIFATSSIWAAHLGAHFSPHRDDPAAWDPVSKTGGMTVRLCPSLRAPPPGERARALTIPQREHHGRQAGTRTQRHALVTACQPGVPRRDPGHPRQRGCSSDGRALRSHRRGRGFKPRQFHLRQRMVSRGRVEAVRLSGSSWFDSTTVPAAPGRTGWHPHIRPRAHLGAVAPCKR
jgi:hypothetical protein